jgi:GH15 family glucan-1,4-alpha-glucosidase
LADFDSPSVFAALLDDAKGGRFALRPAEDDFSTEQRYRPRTNVLVTRSLTASGAFEVTDFMPCHQIRADVFAHGFDAKLGAFMQSYGSPHLDAANLLFHRLGFLQSDDPRWTATVRATQRAPVRDGLRYRYRNDDDFGQPRQRLSAVQLLADPGALQHRRRGDRPADVRGRARLRQSPRPVQRGPGLHHQTSAR